jgi:membrane protein DedA with SNARE-associated domain
LRPALEVLFLLVFAGMGAPMPEEAPLLAAGYHSWRGDAPLGLLIAAGVVGIVVSDTLCFLIGRGWVGMTRSARARYVTRLRDLFRRRGAPLVLVARLLPFGRALIVGAAGMSDMRLLQFLGWDLLGASIATIAWLAVGMRLGPRIDWFANGLRRFQWLLLVGLVLCAVIQIIRLCTGRTGGRATDAAFRTGGRP